MVAALLGIPVACVVVVVGGDRAVAVAAVDVATNRWPYPH